MGRLNVVLVIILVIVAVLIIWWFCDQNKKKSIKNTGSIPAKDARRVGNSGRTGFADRYSASISDRWGSDDTVDPNESVEYSPFYPSESESDCETYTYNKKEYTRKSSAQLMKEFDPMSLLPKEKRPDWFETFHQSPKEGISGTQLIHPRDLAGYGEQMVPLRNICKDLRGGIHIPKVAEYPWGNSVIEADPEDHGGIDIGC